MIVHLTEDPGWFFGTLRGPKNKFTHFLNPRRVLRLAQSLLNGFENRLGAYREKRSGIFKPHILLQGIIVRLNFEIRD